MTRFPVSSPDPQEEGLLGTASFSPGLPLPGKTLEAFIQRFK